MIGSDLCSLWGSRRGHWSKPRVDEEQMSSWDLALGMDCDRSLIYRVSVKNTAQIVIQCSGRNTLCCNKITTCTNSNYVKVIMSLMKDKSSMKYSLQCYGRITEAESETNS